MIEAFYQVYYRNSTITTSFDIVNMLQRKAIGSSFVIHISIPYAAQNFAVLVVDPRLNVIK